MAWIDEAEKTETRVEDEKWLRIPDAPTGKTSEVKIRILDEEPADAWRHWLGDRPYNCPGRAMCPVCKVRDIARGSDPDGYKAEFKMDHRYFFNVLTDNRVKVFSFGNSVGRKLKTFIEKYGDLRDYDVSILKRKTGPLPMNVEYDVIFEGKRLLSKEESLVAENRYDLTQLVVAATKDDLKFISEGQAPTPKEAEEAPKATSKKASVKDMTRLKNLLEPKGLTLGDFGFVEQSPPAADVIEKLIVEIEAE